MQIYIFDEIISKNDKKTIQLLKSNPVFQEKLEKIRKSFNIPKSGFDCESASLKGNYLSDSSGKKLKLPKPFPKEKTKAAYDYMAAFLDDPDVIMSGSGEFRKGIEKIRKEFNLDERWYHPICHIVLFSVPGWIHSPITAFIEKPSQKDLWKRPGIVIRVTENITTTRLCDWLKENWSEIKKRMEQELQITKKIGHPRKLSLSFISELIIKKGRGLNFEEIADEFYETMDKKNPNYRAATDPQNLSNIFSRYSLKASKKKRKK